MRRKVSDMPFRSPNVPVELEKDCRAVNKMAWVWDLEPANAVYLLVKNESTRKHFRFSCFDKAGVFVGNYKNMALIKPVVEAKPRLEPIGVYCGFFG